MKKKLLALAMAAVMMMGLSTTAFAATQNADGTYQNDTSITITKEYTLTNEGTTSPAETFYITQVGDVVITESDATEQDITGTLTISNVSFVAGAAGDETDGTGTFTVTLPTYSKVGVYTYTLKETVGTTAGVTYRDDTIKLVVTVIEQNGLVQVAAVHCEDKDEDKTSSFADNTYSAGSLSVAKSVTGNLGDKDKEFDVTVTFTAPEDKTVQSTISYTVGTTTYTIAPEDWTEGVATVKISISDSDTVTFTNIPYDVTYTVVEDDYTSDGYDAAAYNFSDAAKKIDTESDSVTITNNKTGDVDTGINLDSLPYVMILGLVLIGAAYVISRRRLSDRY